MIIRLSSLGDIVLTTELIRAVRRRFPDARIDYLTSVPFVPLLEFNPHLSGIIAYDKSKSHMALLRERNARMQAEGIDKYDLVIDLHDNIRTRIYRSGIGLALAKTPKNRLRKLALVWFKKNLFDGRSVAERHFDSVKEYGIESDGKGLELWTAPGRKGATEQARTAGKPKVGVCIGARHFTKKYPVAKMTEVLEKLNRSTGVEIVLLGSAEDEADAGMIGGHVKVLNETGKHDILSSAEIISSCDVILTNDSGLMHVAAAFGKPVAALFGSTVTDFGFGPYATPHKVLENKDLACRPCTHIGRSSCPLGHFECMNSINPDEVVSVIDDQLAGLLPRDS